MRSAAAETCSIADRGSETPNMIVLDGRSPSGLPRSSFGCAADSREPTTGIIGCGESMRLRLVSRATWQAGYHGRHR